MVWANCSRIAGFWLRPALRALTSADAEVSLRRNPTTRLRRARAGALALDQLV